ncbi:hypothetical protein CRYUN_Cryun18bG0021700 [Craigia yunnanensis]
MADNEKQGALRSRKAEIWKLAAAQPCPCSSFIFFTHHNKSHLHNLIHFPSFPLSLIYAVDSAHMQPEIAAAVEEEEEEASGTLMLRIFVPKVFKSFGWMLPVILLSLFATGPKAFLMALALPLGQSAITLAFEKLLGRSQNNQKRKVRVRKKTKNTFRCPVKNVKMEEEVQLQEGQKSRKGRKDYQSWVVSDDGSVNEGGNGATSFGGWD